MSNQFRGQLDEARKRREAELRENERREHLLRQGISAEVQRIVVVGPCASGKTLLANALREHGFNAHPVAQEHSYVQSMWMMSKPSHLIYLDTNLENIHRRRKVSWGQAYLDEENARLDHARQYADLIIDTNDKSPDEVIFAVINFLREKGVA